MVGKFHRSARSQPRGCSLTERQNFLDHTPPQRYENLRNGALSRKLIWSGLELFPYHDFLAIVNVYSVFGFLDTASLKVVVYVLTVFSASGIDACL